VTDQQTNIALVLAGGGARAAYQTGVCHALNIILSESGHPFPNIYCGTSAGAINSAFLAAGNDNPAVTSKKLCEMWSRLKPEQVFNTKTLKLSTIGTKWLSGFMLGGLLKDGNPVNALLDASPLKKLIGRHFNSHRIQKNIEKGRLKGLSISTTNYYSGSNVIFFQAAEEIEEWARSDRLSKKVEINVDHIMASSSIPFFFSPVALENSFYGDGSLRQMAPLSPAVKLGADKIIAIGMRYDRDKATAMKLNQEGHHHSPHIAQIAGTLLNSVFLDSLEYDLERLNRMNQIYQQVDQQTDSIRQIDSLLLRPSQDLGSLAGSFTQELPPLLRFLLKSLGVSRKDGSDLLSYLAFDKVYTKPLIDLGQQDTMNKRHEIIDFLRR
jgi:NTE family protein